MGRTILLIEDNEQNRYLVTFILEKHGYRVLYAQNGIDGIEMAKKDAPDMILLDIQLPIMDGYAVAAELRKIESIQTVPIIAITSFAMPGDREKALAAGCTDHITKPIDPETFIPSIEKYFRS